MTQPAEHRIGERAFVPRAVVTAAVDEEGRRDHHAAGARAPFIGLDPRLRAPGGLFGFLGVLPRQAQLARDGAQVVFGQFLRARHQFDVRTPEPLWILGALCQHGGAPGDVAVREWPMPKDVAQTLAQLVADLGDLLVGRPAVRARIAAVLDEGDWSIGGAEDMIVCLVHRPIQPVVWPCLRHSEIPPPLGADLCSAAF